MKKDYKPLIIGILCTLIVFMAVGFALLSQELTITGTSSIDSNWHIRITNIRVKNLTSAYATGTNASADVSGTTGCTTQTAPCDSTTANFEAKLITPGDSITYEVTITNSGNLDGVVESINLTCSENEAITCTTSGLSRADTISHTSPNNTNTVDVTVTYNSATTTQPASTTSSIALTINYQQNLGQLLPTYSAYSIGDKIENYKGSDWYVIKNSTANEDYVTLMKEKVLTNAELGTYAYGEGYNSMEYNWSETCSNGNHGLTMNFNNCSNLNNYDTSKVKEAVETYMTSKDMANDLKEVDGYKTRVIKLEELENNLGYQDLHVASGYSIVPTESTPTWVYSNFVEGQNDVNGYWTMTIGYEVSSFIWSVYDGGSLYENDPNCNFMIRPVINLLKTAIPQN